MTFPEQPARHTVLVAWGADVRADPSTWTWYDVTEDADSSREYAFKEGRSEGATQAETLSVSPALVLRNPNGDYTPDDPRSSLWPGVSEGSPLWWWVDVGHGAYDLVRGFVAGLVPQWADRNNRHKTVDVAVCGRLGILNRGARPLPAPLVRSVAASGPVAYWPLTDGDDAGQAASGLPNGTPMTVSGSINFGAVTGPAGAPTSTPELISGGLYTGDLSAPVVMTTATGWTIEGWVRASFNDADIFGDADPVQFQTIGTPIGSDGWTVSLFADTGEYGIFINARDGNNGTGFTASLNDADFQGQWHQWRLNCTQVGGNIEIRMWLDGVTSGGVTTIAGSCGRISKVTVARPGRLDIATATGWQSISVAHVAVWNTPTPPVDTYDAGIGWPGETPSRRIVRVCTEEGVPVTVDPGTTDFADTFDRTSSTTWGDDYFEAGTGSVTSGDWQVTGGAGLHRVQTTSAYRFSYSTTVYTDAEVLGRVQVAVPTGGDLEPTVMLRVRSSNDYYQCRVRLAPGGAVQAQVRKLVAGGDTAVATRTVPNLTHNGTTPLWVRAQIAGNRIRMRIWADGTTERDIWHVTVTDTSIQGNGGAGVRSGVGAGNSNTKPVVFSWLDLEITDLADRMGPQVAGTTVDVLQDAERVGMGRLSERNWGIHYRPRSTLYSQNPALILDASDGELADPFSPRRDLTIIRNEVQATRPGGSTVTYADLDSQAKGKFQDSYTVNSEADAALLPYAQARVAIGTVEGYRYPSLSTNLARHPRLIGDWHVLQLGDRIQATNARTKLDHAEDLVDQIVEGRTQVVAGRRAWRVTMITSPAAPYKVGVIEGTGGETSPPWRLDATAEIAQGYGAGATSLSVATTDGPLLSTSSSDYPVDVTVDGVPMRVTAVSGASSPQTVTVVRGIDGWDRPLKAGNGRGQLRLWRGARTGF